MQGNAINRKQRLVAYEEGDVELAVNEILDEMGVCESGYEIDVNHFLQFNIFYNMICVNEHAS